jgi:hypothetical protein
MAHLQYSQPTLDALSTKELKTIASKIGAIPDGDKRIKKTWVAAIIDHQTKFSPAKVAAMSAHIETVMNRLESITPAVNELSSELPSDLPSDLPSFTTSESNTVIPVLETDSYVPTPLTHADDVAFATAMGLTYDDVFGEALEEMTPDLEPNPQVLEPTHAPLHMREASIVALVAVLIFGMAFLVIKMGLTSIAWVIAALSPIALGLWRYLLPDAKKGETVDYFPSAIA